MQDVGVETMNMAVSKKVLEPAKNRLCREPQRAIQPQPCIKQKLQPMLAKKDQDVS